VEIRGRTFLVTGGKSGLGEATAARLEEAGGRVEILDLPETDVTDEAAVRERIGACEELHGVVNCAGIGGGARVTKFDLTVFRRIVDVNLIGTFTVLRHAAERMAANEPDGEGQRGVIVNTASNAAFDGQIGQAAYSASKAGVAGMTLPVAREPASSRSRRAPRTRRCSGRCATTSARASSRRSPSRSGSGAPRTSPRSCSTSSRTTT
jgi:NAD(P)-dependent dehydrogenase (short-subunit alcohol dehydrogenase family)